MKISLITVTYNSSKTLSATLSSVLSQTYSDIEYIVVDGLSEDNTVSIIEEYSHLFAGRLRFLSEPDKGIYDAMNKGIQMATGDIIGILNSDDLLMDDNVLKDIALAFDDKTDAICGNLYFVDVNDVNRVVRIWKGSPYRSFTKGWHPAHPTFYARRQVYEKYGAFDITFDVSADFELMLRLIEKYHICVKYVDRYMVKMRVGGESTGSIQNIIKGNKNIIKAFKKNDVSVSLFYPIIRLFPKAVNLMKCKLRF
ncbi:glycosyltransferase family 2 protein [Phocaeicola vulgatus]|uniref:glycosyltransferase family 2 protein n=1 Tax=Phocaeicola vulgatus TaxID=821 RepID=UPI001F3C02B5|nr:glycosyltransferase family 2 protein [Phocaeicola vulgatus]MCE8864113.1 glycosyltransferase [Phocaeicola vulgatus]